MLGQNAPVPPQIPVRAGGSAGPVMAQSSLALYHSKGKQSYGYVIGKKEGLMVADFSPERV